MMDDIEKTKPVAEAPADDDETGAGCDVCMPPIALVGADDYDYKYLCMPSPPWSKGGVEPPQFLAKDEKLPLTLSLIMGLQHALAMVAGRRDGVRFVARVPRFTGGRRPRRHRHERRHAHRGRRPVWKSTSVSAMTRRVKGAVKF